MGRKNKKTKHAAMLKATRDRKIRARRAAAMEATHRVLTERPAKYAEFAPAAQKDYAQLIEYDGESPVFEMSEAYDYLYGPNAPERTIQFLDEIHPIATPSRQFFGQYPLAFLAVGEGGRDVEPGNVVTLSGAFDRGEPEFEAVFDKHKAAFSRRRVRAGSRFSDVTRVLVTTWWTTSTFSVDRVHSVCWSAAYVYLPLGDDGTVLSDPVIWSVPGVPVTTRVTDRTTSVVTREITLSETATVLMPLFVGLSFVNCKNVTTRDETERRNVSEARARKVNVPRLTYRALNLRGDGHSRLTTTTDASGREVRLHMCRGHFKTYKPPHPRFGREGEYGTYWCPAHVRGNPDLGAVVKDYKV